MIVHSNGKGSALPWESQSVEERPVVDAFLELARLDLVRVRYSCGRVLAPGMEEEVLGGLVRVSRGQ